MYTINDIDVFIATHNRSLYLTETIDNILSAEEDLKLLSLKEFDKSFFPLL